MNERALIERLLVPLATHPAARGLADDAAVFAPPLGRELVFTHDMLVSGVHFLPDDPPSDIAWKLLAVNLSDLAAMGARPMGVLIGLGLAGQGEAWLTAFTAGLQRALGRWDVPLLGGDTVSGLTQVTLSLTAVGAVEPGRALPRAGARPGDHVWVSGSIGDAGLGLALLQNRLAAADPVSAKILLNRYRRPEPRLALGRALAGIATACMDVSDGLLIDADRLARASSVGITVELAAVPLSAAARAHAACPLDAATAGDDYELLFTAPSGAADAIVAAAATLAITRVGTVARGLGVTVLNADGVPVTPARLGWEHGADGS